MSPGSTSSASVTWACPWPSDLSLARTRAPRRTFQTTFGCLLSLTERPERFHVASTALQLALVHERLSELPGGSLLIKPCGRDTPSRGARQPCRPWERTRGTTLGFSNSDHRIGDTPELHASVHRAIELDEADHDLVTLSVTPKPLEHRLQRARACLGAERYPWNADTFVSRCDAIRHEFDNHAPHVMGLRPAATAELTVDTVSPTTAKTSTDFAVTERADNAGVKCCDIVPLVVQNQVDDLIHLLGSGPLGGVAAGGVSSGGGAAEGPVLMTGSRPPRQPTVTPITPTGRRA